MDIKKTIRLEPGHYVIAVSGGVDSMVLLDLLAKKYQPPAISRQSSVITGDRRQKTDDRVRFTVAHFDHGIREVSHMDRLLVHEIADEHRLPFVFEEGNLGAGASEAAAREARYAFLRKVQEKTNARGIITAHHHDDVVETALINLLRGTGRKGMSSLKSTDGIIRPLLHVPKKHLRSYAEANGLTWHEDSTNQDQNYKRNYVRHHVIPKAKKKSGNDYHKLVALIRRQREINHAIDESLGTILHVQPSRQSLRRRDVIGLPYQVATELVAEWLRQNGKRQLSRWLVDRLTVYIRTASPGTEMLLDSQSKVSFHKTDVEFVNL